MYKCEHVDCKHHRDNGPANAVIQLKGENLCQHHYDMRLKESAAAFDAMWEQHMLDQRRIRESVAWAGGFKVSMI